MAERWGTTFARTENTARVLECISPEAEQVFGLVSGLVVGDSQKGGLHLRIVGRRELRTEFIIFFRLHEAELRAHLQVALE